MGWYNYPQNLSPRFWYTQGRSTNSDNNGQLLGPTVIAGGVIGRWDCSTVYGGRMLL